MANGVTRSPENGMSVLVAGGGIGGLMTALECWRNGCEVRVFERAKMSSAQGDSFSIGPSALAAFRNWPEMERKNQEIFYDPLFAMHNVQGELMKGPFKFSNLIRGDPKVKQTCRHMRPQFHAMLLEQLRQVGIEVEYDKTVIEYFDDEQRNTAGVVLQDGSRHKADLVVAADGLRTTAWSLISDTPVSAKSSGHSVFRVAYPVELILNDPVIAETFSFDASGQSILHMYSGPNMHGIFWRNEKWMTWAIDHPDNNGTSAESWSHRVHPDEALKFTATLPGWPEVADRVIKATPPDKLVDWTLMWRDPQTKWTSPNGRVVLLGDAAHTFLPTSGNGGTQAMEDAVSLAACVAIAGKDNIAHATRVHNLLRFERVSFCQALGVGNRELRNTNKNKDAAGKTFVLGAWLVEHDPEQYVKDNYDDALEHIISGKPFKNTNIPPGIDYKPWTIDGLTEALEKGEPNILDGDWH